MRTVSGARYHFRGAQIVVCTNCGHAFRGHGGTPMRDLRAETLNRGGRTPMNRIILADEQAIFRAGTARVLALEDDMRIISQVEQPARLIPTIKSFQASI